MNEASIVREIKKGTRLPFPKECGNCGQIYHAVTVKTIICTAGHLWFNCPCTSTLFIPKGKHTL